MKIRSITCFIDPSYPLDERQLDLAGEFLQIAQPIFSEFGYEVQSSRLAIIPFSQLLPGFDEGKLPRFAIELEDKAVDRGFAYVSLGPAFPETSEAYAVIPEALAATKNAFFAGSLTTQDGRVSLQAIKECARVIHSASVITADGFANLRFAALANVPAGSPFFPAAYHQGGEPTFALATEAADLAVAAFSQVASLDEARESLVKSIETHARLLTKLAQRIEKQTRVSYCGIDFSLAPFPSEEVSLGTAFERLGIPAVGNHGSLAAAAILADTLDQADFLRAGFSGLMLPLLEDATLARRAAEGLLGVKDLLLYSAVCGTGLDSIPLPGDTSVEQLRAVLLDLASLSTRLAKPLTARLMPIPGKKAGDPTGFDFPYFANSRILPLTAQPLGNYLDKGESFSLHPRAR
jgi:hypothetical protein